MLAFQNSRQSTLDTSEDIELAVVNDEKIVTLWDDSYYIKILSNCSGTLNINVREKGYVNGDIRELTFENIPLEIGTLYKQGCGIDYFDEAEEYAVEALNGDKIEATTDTLNIQSLEPVIVTYNANGGNTTEKSKAVREGEYIILPTAGKSGCDFIGWSTTNGNTSEFDAGSALKITGDITLYAIWGKISVIKPSVKSISISDIEVNYKSSAKIVPQLCVYDGVKYTAQYKSSDPSIAVVNKDGDITTVHKGSTTITCTVIDE